MQILNYTLQSAANIADPKKRTQLLLGAAIEQVRTVQLLSQILAAAEQAAMSVDDPAERSALVQSVEKVMQRMGYDTETNSFQIKTSPLVRQPLVSE
jgi:hypothetical protein